MPMGWPHRVQASSPGVSNGHAPRAPGLGDRVVTYSAVGAWKKSTDLGSRLLANMSIRPGRGP